MSWKEDLRDASKRRGWFASKEGVKLASLARIVPTHDAIVEIGAFAGKSTAYLAAGSRNGFGAHITSIDDWSPAALPGGTDQDAANEVLDEYLATTDFSLVTPIRARSTWLEDYWVQPIALLFLDATHIYEDTRHDIEKWGEHVYLGGLAAFHDYHTDHPGVIQATDEAVASGRWAHVSLTKSLRVLRRIA